ncbi:hypothetical protein V8C34DRAFT_291701 [Trichoderma compactum]
MRIYEAGLEGHVTGRLSSFYVRVRVYDNNMCFTFYATALSSYDGNSVGHTTSVALHCNSTQTNLYSYNLVGAIDCKGWSISLPGIVRLPNLGATAHGGQAMQCNPPTRPKNTHKERKTASHGIILR